jgi:hypothetical protein
MDELFFGVKRRKPKRSPKLSPKRSPKRSTKTKTKRSPKRKTTMCSKKLSLPKLRKLAVEHGVNIFSEAKTAVNKRTGMPKKPKMVGCSTLMKRLNEAGLGYLYKAREVKEMPDVDQSDLFMEDPMSVSYNPMPMSVQMQADPACAAEFKKLAEKQPNNKAQAKFLKEYKGYAMGQGPCDQRELVPTHIHGFEEDLDDFAEVAGFDMSYGKRYTSGARPKKTQKHVTTIVVKGRTHNVFKGKEGGLYYLKGKTGRKIYIDKERLRKRK